MNILVLAGTGEARVLINELCAQGHTVTASLSGATRMPADLGCETRSGGFGGGEEFINWMKQNATEAVIDATHPFAHRISKRSAEICQSHSIPYLQILREEWRISDYDKSFYIDQPEDANEHISLSDTVFLATGRQTLQAFENVRAQKLYCRQIDPPEGRFPFANGAYVIGRPPFSQADEEVLFTKLGITCLVVKNAGGDASRTKLDAAIKLGLKILLINRPSQPDAPHVATVGDALTWVSSLADH